MAEFEIEIGNDSQQLINVLEDKIYEFNSLAINRNDGLVFNRVVRDGNGNVLAGVAGWT